LPLSAVSCQLSASSFWLLAFGFWLLAFGFLRVSLWKSAENILRMVVLSEAAAGEISC
jgi:hypothetical protein